MKTSIALLWVATTGLLLACGGSEIDPAADAGTGGAPVAEGPEYCDPDTICGPDSWCDYPDDLCGTGVSTGKCTPKPTWCEWGNALDGVCGCDGHYFPLDGNTPKNDCVPHMAGVDTAADGRCDPQ